MDTILSLLWVFMVGISFFLFGWKVGLLAVALSFLYATTIRPIAASLVWKHLGRRTPFGFEDEYWSGGKLSVEVMMQRYEQTNKMLERVGRDQKIRKVLEENGKVPEDLKEMYRFLLENYVGIELTKQIIANPDDLRLALKLREQGFGEKEGLGVDVKFVLKLLQWPRPKI